MLHEYMEKIAATESSQAYEAVLQELTHYLSLNGHPDEAQKLMEVASLKKNRFSARETEEDFAKKKKAVLNYCEILVSGQMDTGADMIQRILENFSSFCRTLFNAKVNEKCSEEARKRFSEFSIQNEYDLQRLMLAAVSVVFSDARVEASQDSGHHTVRKDIVIDSESSVIELKCTRTGVTERQLSEEIASDIIHYKCDRLYFYVYDKAGVIANPYSFRRTYEEQETTAKDVKMVIYSHSDI